MDEYTKATKVWLDERFRKTSGTGIYQAHQPIYGFEEGNSDVDVMSKYVTTFQIMKVLSRIDFKTFIDVGGAEGYKSHVVRSLFGVDVTNSDLSDEACKRAREIFKVRSIPADIHELPFDDGQFDVVLSSMAIEHVTDEKQAVRELLRVARKAVVITVPHEPIEAVECNIEKKHMASHIHQFDDHSFDHLRKDNLVFVTRMSTPLSEIMMERGKTFESKYPGVILKAYDLCVEITKRFHSGRMAALLVRLDDIASVFSPSYHGLVFAIVKDRGCLKEGRRIRPGEIISMKVHYHYFSVNKNKMEMD